MGTELTMPKLSATMEEGTVVAWHKSKGERVSAGEIILEIETDKTTLTIEAPIAGYLGKPHVAAGETALVGARLVSILAEDEDESIDSNAAPGAADSQPKVVAGEAAHSAPSSSATHSPAVRAHRFASPLARRLAREKGVDLNSMRGSGPGGRIVRADINAATREPRPMLRRQNARQVETSRREIPAFTLTRWIDMQAVLSQVARGGRQRNATDFLLYALARAVNEVSEFRCVWNARDMLAEDLRATNIGLVVSTERGLMIPVLSNIGELTVDEIANRRWTAVEAARQGKLAQTPAGPASISLSSLIREEADEFEAIISPHQTAILAVGRIMERVVAHRGSIAARRGCVAKLSADHRVIDGRTGAKFIGSVARVLEGIEEKDGPAANRDRSTEQ
jgi:pyruvate dehydrogenase E2 component (dihydrolipoamide acetyltransferase)